MIRNRQYIGPRKSIHPVDFERWDSDSEYRRDELRKARRYAAENAPCTVIVRGYNKRRAVTLATFIGKVY